MGPEPFVGRLMAQAHKPNSQKNRLYFFDYSNKKVCRQSFINRAKYIAKLTPFEQIHLNEIVFNSLLKHVTSFFHIM